MQHHPIGTEIYYAGDVANLSGFGKIVRLTPNERFGATYDIELEDGRELPGIPTILLGDKYEGHGGTRLVTRAAYEAWRAERAGTWQRQVEESKQSNIADIPHRGSDVREYFSVKPRRAISQKLEQVLGLFRQVDHDRPVLRGAPHRNPDTIGEHPSSGRVLKTLAFLVRKGGLMRREGGAKPIRQGGIPSQADGQHPQQCHEAFGLCAIP